MTQRPLSPHLQIYRPMLSMTMSILHRVTGLGLALGMSGLVLWLTAAATSDAYFAFMQGFFTSWIGRLLVFGMTWTLLHHMLGGLRYLLWDTGRGFALHHIEWMVRANLIGSVLLTLILWVGVYWVRA